MSTEHIWSPRYETLGRAELAQLQLERLQATINRAASNVPFYSRRLAELGLEPEDFQSPEDLRRLPFTTKEELRASYPYDMVAVPLREVVRFHLSSGTTGAPTVIAYTANDLAHWTDLVARNLAAAGVGRDDVVQIFFGYGLFSGGFGLHQGAEALGASVIPVSSLELQQQLQIMQDFRSTVLVGLPSYALTLARELERSGLDPNGLSLRVGLFGAEPWSEKTRKEIEARLYLEAFDIYGLSEMGGPGVSGECQYHSGLHLAEDHFLIEVLDPVTGEPVAEGEEGELVFTSLTREALPLIRYRSGDLSRISTEPCKCGRTSARMERVSRRTDDMLIVHGINVFPEDVAAVLKGFAELGSDFQLVAERQEGLDVLEVRAELVEMPSDVRAMHQLVRERLEQALGFEVRIALVEPGSLGAGSAGFKRVVDKRDS